MLNLKNNIQINYDKEYDILYISFGDPREAYGDEKYDGIVFRYDMTTDELVGITILDFQVKLNTNSLSLMPMPICIDFQEIKKALN